MVVLEMRRALRSLVPAIVLLVPFAAASAAYTLTDFSKPGATTTALFDINNSGHMVGYFFEAGAEAQGFFYDGSTFTTLSGPTGAVSSSALGISDGGVIVGNFATSLSGPQQGFIYSGGSYTSFNVAGATDTILRGISPDGRYVSGYFSTPTVAGTGFVYDTVTTMLTLVSEADSIFTIAQGINSSYVMVGSDIRSGPPLTRPGFLYDIASDTRTDVEIAGAERTALRSIDDAGILAGWFIAGGLIHGFIGSIASFEQIDFAGADATFVEGSNNARVLVGLYQTASGMHAFVATPVPEPSVLGLLAIALGGLGWLGRPPHARVRPADLASRSD